MENANYLLYCLFSATNGLLCIWAIIKMYGYFRPDIEPPKLMRVVTHGWVACLMMLAILQLNVVIRGDLGLDWTGKLFGTLFAWISLKFARISNYIKESTEL